MGSKSVEDEVLAPAAAAAGVHLSALRLDGLNRIQDSKEQQTTSGLDNGHQEPFVIG
jgi:uridine kinase